VRAARAAALAVLLAAGALASSAAAAPGDGPGGVDRARSLVGALRKADDEDVRRDLYDLGADALGPLADAIAAETDAAAWTRLVETLESVLDARLAKLDDRLARDAADRRERSEHGMPASSPEGETATALREAERDILGAGYAAARSLSRERGVMDDLAALARESLTSDLLDRLRREVREGSAEAREALAARLAGLGPLAAPLVAAALAGEDPGARGVAASARDRACGRLVALFRGEAEEGRRFGTDGLFGMGELALPFVEPLAREGTPDERVRARRLVRRIRWAISDELYRRLGHLLEGFEAASWGDRRVTVYEIERQGGPESVPTLRRILARDESPDVKVAAAEGLARQRDPVGLVFLRSIGIAPLTQSPEVIAAIAMDQGIRYLQIRRYEKAIEEFRRVLEAQPANEIALYNLACAYALKFARDGDQKLRETALDYLEASVAKGFDDVEHMLKDEDLASLRDEDRFKAIADGLRRRKAEREESER
jgi:tetratricopeptide (TPR) repeat protein